MAPTRFWQRTATVLELASSAHIVVNCSMGRVNTLGVFHDCFLHGIQCDFKSRPILYRGDEAGIFLNLVAPLLNSIQAHMGDFVFSTC